MIPRRSAADSRQSVSAPDAEAGATHPGPTRGLRRVVGLLLAGIGGGSVPVLMYYLLDRGLPTLSPDGGDLVLGVAVLLGICAVSTVVHELGHAVGGMIAGFRSVAFGIWPVFFSRPLDGRWRVRVHTGLDWGLGMTLSVPTDRRDLRRRLLYMAAGGPAANLLIALLSLTAFLMLTPGPAAGSPTALALALLAAAVWGISLLFAVVPLLPTDDMTDGFRLWALLQGGRPAQVQEAMTILVGLSAGGSRPRSWDPVLLATALTAPADTTTGMMARHFAFQAAVDRGDIAAARDVLDHSLAAAEGSRGEEHADLYFEGAWFAAVHDGDPATARRRLARATTLSSRATFERSIAEAALFALEGHADSALARLRAAEAQLTREEDAFGHTDFARDQVGHVFALLGDDASGSPASSGS